MEVTVNPAWRLFSLLAISTLSILSPNIQAATSTYYKQVYSYDWYTDSSVYDVVQLKWDRTKTVSCPSIAGTLISFPGGNGNTHGESGNALESLETALGPACVRVIRVNIDPFCNNTSGPNSACRNRHTSKIFDDGYWRYDRSFREAAGLMSSVIRSAKRYWKDADGQAYAQGKIIVAGAKTASMIAASALESRDSYQADVARTIMISGPLGADISAECGLMVSANTREWLDLVLRTGSACREDHGEIGAGKDIVNLSNTSFRPYLFTDHEIAILVGAMDTSGCRVDDSVNISPSNCGNWNAPEAVARYIRSIGAGDDSFFVRGGYSNKYAPNTLNVIIPGAGRPSAGHDLWELREVRKLVCQNVLNEVKKPLSYCEANDL
ncbi:MAG: hypothetical protein KZQ76_06975 [Candidatus Thiodiazotropha sp. (ex Epidulcina cf. delphinae)]|nr:hypothetical protein [Candidatus Thiodiazotropha sp. (ex Epidulcina cf. delphinae)]